MSDNKKAKILETIQIIGEIKVTSPLLIGDGEKNNEAVDALVLRNRKDQAYIPATSLAGVLRHQIVNYLATDAKTNEVLRNIIFGSLNQGATVKTGDHQSILRVYDVILTGADDKSDVSIVTRDGVRLEHYRRVAKDGHKFDYEAIEKGAKGSVEMEGVIRQGHLDVLKKANTSLDDESALQVIREAIYTVVNILHTGISVGRYTTKGLGQIQSDNMTAHVYQLKTIDSVSKWLMREPKAANGDVMHEGRNVVPATKDMFTMKVWANIDSSLIVRTVSSDPDIDSTMLKSGDDYVIPGSSIKGVLRHHSQYILEKMGVWDGWVKPSEEKEGGVNRFIHLFGGMMDKPEKDEAEEQNQEENQEENIIDGVRVDFSKIYKSRVSVSEAYIKTSDSIRKMKQTRNRIDRFTGGTIDSALFDSEPIWQVEKDCKEGLVSFEIKVHSCAEEEAGLMFVLLRDLWMGKLTFGGEASIGRGRLHGVRAEVVYDNAKYVFENECDTDGNITKYAVVTKKPLKKADSDSNKGKQEKEDVENGFEDINLCIGLI